MKLNVILRYQNGENKVLLVEASEVSSASCVKHGETLFAYAGESFGRFYNTINFNEIREPVDLTNAEAVPNHNVALNGSFPEPKEATDGTELAGELQQ